MYLINQQVEFDPDQKRMTNRHTGKEVHLQIPAALCFLYLIVNRHEVASQSVLMKAGWGKRNEVTTANTFYQSILTLRNALEEVGLSRETVKTLARCGLILAENTTVETLQPASTEPTPTASALAEGKLESPRLMAASLTAAGVMLIFIWLAAFWRHPEMPFQHFIPASLHSSFDAKCEVYQTAHETFSSRNLNLLQQHPALCAEGKHLFISGESKAERIAAFVCNKDARTDGNAICLSHYFWTHE